MSFRRSRFLVAATATAALLGLSACGGGETPPVADPTATVAPTQTAEPTPTIAPVIWETTPKHGAKDVAVDTRVTARVEDGALTEATLTYTSKKGNKVSVDGWLESGVWTAADFLEPGVKYVLSMTATNRDGETLEKNRVFTTENLELDDQIYIDRMIPNGTTVGVGMPVIIQFDLPVEDKANFERHLEVTSTPSQEGSWYWLSDREVHWRPKTYWKPGTKVHVEADLNGVPAGGGLYGQLSKTADFTVGREVIAKVDLQTHMMDVFINGEKKKSLPISGGREGWETRSGVKVIMTKQKDFEMKAASIGLEEEDEDWYEDVKVKHALRLTHSGEFIHTAPWSVAQQGKENVSHGCTGMSEESSDWVWKNFRVGDVVETTGSEKPMTMGNGYADWNLSWSEYRAGSAL